MNTTDPDEDVDAGEDAGEPLANRHLSLHIDRCQSQGKSQEKAA